MRKDANYVEINARKRERDEKGKIKLTKINEIEGIRAA